MKKKFILIPIILIIVLIVTSIILFVYSISPVDKNSNKEVLFTVEQGWGKNRIIEELKKNDLIRSEIISKIVIKFKSKELYAGTYKLTKNLSTIEIIEMLENQENIENESVTITFVEGKRLKNYLTQINENFGFKEDEMLEKLSNKDFLNTLIDKYWFITEDILKDGIYYPLEGYFFPDTYEFKKNSTFEDIIYKFLDNMDSKLSDYKEEIELSSYNIHELLTLASIIELEGVNSKDRGMVSGVFYNRLNSKMTLGSDVTTYYAVDKDFSSDLSNDDLNSCNGYNTRGSCVEGLPIGPICSPSLSSIAASIEPIENDYLYFVADKDKNTYFSKDSVEHAQTVAKLKEEGKWLTY